MLNFLGTWGLWIKSLHVIAVIAWMAGMLYLPRLFVYHCGAPAGSRQSETFKVMERRLLKAIINPAMIVTWITGLAMAFDYGYWGESWFQAKFAFVILLSAVHGFFSRWRRDFEQDRNEKSAGYFKIINEVPTLFMIAIVVFVIVKPF